MMLMIAPIISVPPVLTTAFPQTDAQISLSQPLTIRWQYASGETINLTPAADGDRIYLPLAAGTLVSLRASDGQMLWKTDFGGDVSASPVADEYGVYIASEASGAPTKEPRATGALRALGRDTGVTLWMRTLRRPFHGSLAMNQTTLFGGTTDGRVFAINKKTGQFAWVTQHWAAFASHPVVYGSKLYIGSDDGTLFALDQVSGKTLWRYRTRGAVRGRVAIVDDVIYFGSADGYVYALGAVDGRLRWRTRTGAGVQAVASAGGGLVVASLDNFVYFLSLSNGSRLWKRQLAGRLLAEPFTTVDGALFTPLAGDAGVVLDLRDGKQLNTLLVGEDNNTAAAPVAVGDVLFVTTRQGLIAFSSPNTASRSIKK
jgi:outer membrane protein assembly factor BamB